jgi:aryl-alcohol dehydrogenase-like predicted oxidoreductase
MNQRPLGRSGLNVSPLAFGGNVFGWTVDQSTSFKLLDAWVGSGMNLIDTADVYSRWVEGNRGGESETVIGQWLKRSGKRNQVVLATKVGKEMGPGLNGLSPAYIRQAVDASLKRLQTDHIDLYQSHDDDPNTPLEETMQAFADLIKAGKVRAIGASNFGAPRLQRALEVSRKLGLPRYETLQPLFNLYNRGPYETGLQAVCVEHQIGVINFYALASGFLTGKYRNREDMSKSLRGQSVVGKYLNERGLRILAALDKVAARTGSTPGQAALAWQMVQPGIAAPIASASSLAQLKELVAAAELKLDEESVAELTRASSA